MTWLMWPRALALLIGTLLAGLVIGVVLWMRHEPITLHEIELRVTDERGQPIEVFGWTICEQNSEAYSRMRVIEALHPDGHAVVKVTSECVGIEVQAAAFGRVKPLEFHRTTIPARLDVTLPDLGVVRGVVIHAGQPVAGARVELLAEGLPATEGIPSGLFYGYDGFRTTSDSSGAFSIGSDFPHMPYFARACAIGFATGIAGPVRVGDPPIVIELPSGGTLEGTVRMRNNGEAGGASIMLYRDDYEPEVKSECGHTVVNADSAGRFRFEHVPPGDWLVKLVRSRTRGDEREQVPVDFVPFVASVRENETTRIDMDLAQPVAHLDGELRLNGRSWSKAYVCLRTVGDRAFTIDTVPGGNAGKWSVRARTPGKYRLIVRGDHQHSLEPEQVSEIVELSIAGTQWKRDVNWRHGDANPPVLVQPR